MKGAIGKGKLKLGEKLYLAAFMVSCDPISALDINILNAKMCKVAGMNTCGIRPAVYRFPTVGGKGGIGFTHIQPIVESFIVSDWWEDFNHFFYVFASCKPYKLDSIREILEGSGYGIISEKFLVLAEEPESKSLLERLRVKLKKWLGGFTANIGFIL